MKKHTDIVIDREGNAVVGAEVYVRAQSDNSLVQLYSDDGSTTTANPVITNSDGMFSFWTANNTLKLQVWIDGVQENEVTNFQHFDIDGITTFGFSLIDDANAAAALTTLGVSAFAQTILDDADAATARATLGITSANVKLTESFVIACSDETTALTTGTAKVTFRMPYAFTVSAVRASVTTAPTGAALQVDINEGGVSILSTKLTIDATEKTSTTAATPAVISDASLADDAEITIDIDAVGSTIAGAGLKVVLIGTRT